MGTVEGIRRQGVGLDMSDKQMKQLSVIRFEQHACVKIKF